jgi:hypothetical protein
MHTVCSAWTASTFLTDRRTSQPHSLSPGRDPRPAASPDRRRGPRCHCEIPAPRRRHSGRSQGRTSPRTPQEHQAHSTRTATGPGTERVRVWLLDTRHARRGHPRQTTQLEGRVDCSEPSWLRTSREVWQHHRECFPTQRCCLSPSSPCVASRPLPGPSCLALSTPVPFPPTRCRHDRDHHSRLAFIHPWLSSEH